MKRFFEVSKRLLTWTISAATLITALVLIFEAGKWVGLADLKAAEMNAYNKGRSDASAELTIVHQSELETVRQEGKDAGYILGSQEQKKLYENQDNQTLLIAKMIAIINSPPVLRAVPEDSKKSIEDANKAINQGEFDLAGQSLDSAFKKITSFECVPDGQEIEVALNNVIDECETKVEVALVKIYDDPLKQEVGLMLNGRFDRISVGERARLSNDFQCYVTLMRFTARGGALSPVIRFTCDK